MTVSSTLNAHRPTRLNATFHEKVWGSTDLEPLFPKSTKKIGEVWFGAEANPPVLVKFIHTTENLSVQVHPEGKTEMWYILHAEPGARIALGFQEPISRERLRVAAASGEIEKLLRWFPVKAGETYLSRARTVHAIGAGIALCEIQQNYLVTYRLYDYGRPRELHIDAAVAVADLGKHPGPAQPAEFKERQRLVSCEYFETDLLEIKGPAHPIPTDDSAFLVFLEGSGSLAGEAFQAGEVWLLPAGNWQLDARQFPTRALHVRWPNR